MRFEKVSYEQYFKDVTDKMGIKELGELSDSEINEIHNLVKEEYNNIILPKRAYRGSAGYDIYSPVSFSLEAGQSIFFWTGIRVILDANKVLMIYPRSSLGTKYKVQFDNVIPIIDADYALADNEGHIGLQFTNNSTYVNTLTVSKGDRIAQGIIQKYYTVDDDIPSLGHRSGEGFGSSGR